MNLYFNEAESKYFYSVNRRELGTMLDLRSCAMGWMPDVELLNFVTSREIIDFCEYLIHFLSKFEDNKETEKVTKIASQILHCAECWSPRTCLLGNVTAQEVVELCSSFLKVELPSLCEACSKQREAYGNCDRRFNDICSCKCHNRLK